MNDQTFVYTTYIRTSPERLWEALIDPAFTSRYWGVTFESDWTVGSTITWHLGSVPTAHPEQVVLEFDPYRRLSYTYHTVTPEIAHAVGWSDELRAKLAAEPHSKIRFDLEQIGEMVKLTLVQDGFGPGSLLPDLVSEGWTVVLSNLKTLLETGEPLPKRA